jgi:hypothetical protein
MSTLKETDYYFRLAKEFQAAKDASDVFKKRAEKMRAELVQAVTDLGYEDDKHHRWMESDDLQIKYERRVSKRLDLEAVEAWAKENGVWDDIKEVVEVVNEDRLMALAWDNPEIQKVVQSLYVETENYALKVIDV